jgi:hypothetical protein
MNQTGNNTLFQASSALNLLLVLSRDDCTLRQLQLGALDGLFSSLMTHLKAVLESLFPDKVGSKRTIYSREKSDEKITSEEENIYKINFKKVNFNNNKFKKFGLNSRKFSWISITYCF